MTQSKDYNLGVMFRREHAPAHLPEFARKAEAAGFDELWVVEDAFYTSGIALAATALACTESIRIGLGIMPAVVRNPVFAAMEIATLAGLHPGRFLPGFGHGVAGWMRQIGAFPPSQLTVLEEVAVAVRALLRGERFTFEGSQIQLDDVELLFPPEQVPPVSLGVRGPKSLALSGRVADGTILAEFAAPAYVTWAREQIKMGKQDAGVEGDHRLTVFAFACAGETAAAAREEMRPLVAEALAAARKGAQFAPLGIMDEAEALLDSGDQESFTAALPDDWIDRLTICGTPEDWQTGVDKLVEAGADTVVLVPLPDKGPEEIEMFARQIQRVH